MTPSTPPGGALQSAEISRRIPEAIRVVDAHAGYRPGGQQAQEEVVRRGEDLRHLLTHGSQLVDGEEAAVVDLLPRRAERREPVRLRVEQSVERIEAGSSAGITIEDADGLFDGTGHLGRSRDQVGQAAFGDDLLAPPLGDQVGVALVLGWQPLERGDDALEFQQVRDRLPEETPSPPAPLPSHRSHLQERGAGPLPGPS